MQNSPEVDTFIYRKIKNGLMHSIYPNLLTTIPYLVILSSLLIFKLKGYVNLASLISWLAVFLTFTLCQGALAIWFNKTKDQQHLSHLHFQLLIADIAFIGILWGTAGVLFMPQDPIGQSYLILILAFVAAGGAIYLSGLWLAAAIYATAVLIPLACSLAFSFFSQSHHEVYLNIVVGLVGYWAFLLALSYYCSKIIAENFRHSLVNKVLEEDLFQANEQLEKLNLASLPEKEKLFLSQTSQAETSQAVNQEFELKDVLSGADTQKVLEIRFMQSRAFARRHDQSLGVCCININEFKDIKLKLGQEFANIVVKTVGLRLQYCKRDTDILCRLADEGKFILVISEVVIGSEVMTVVNRILKMLEEKSLIYDSKFQIKTGIGISLFPKDGDDLHELIKNSEIALSHLYSQNKPETPQFQIYDRETMGSSCPIST